MAAEWCTELAAHARSVAEKLGRPAGLAVVLVGSRPDSALYVARKQEACHRAGVRVDVVQLPTNVAQQELEAAVSGACRRGDVDGVLVQLPLPQHLDEGAVMECLDPAKDVDGFHPLNMG